MAAVLSAGAHHAKDASGHRLCPFAARFESNYRIVPRLTMQLIDGWIGDEEEEGGEENRGDTPQSVAWVRVQLQTTTTGSWGDLLARARDGYRP